MVSRSSPGTDTHELSATNNGLTVKRCLPFLDALNTGWLLPLAATVRLEISDSGREVAAGWEFDREMVSPHSAFQAAGNPYEPRPLLKFHNPWSDPHRRPAGAACSSRRSTGRTRSSRCWPASSTPTPTSRP